MERTHQDSFENYDFSQELLRGIYSSGHQKPSILQVQALPHILDRKDTMVSAPSGYGKTSLLAISSLGLLDRNLFQLQVIILAPTRQLALGTHRLLAQLGQYTGLRSECLIGGAAVREQRQRLRQGGIQVVVGCPGRTLDTILSNTLNTNNLRLLVIDEADQMFSRGFRDQILEMIKFIPADTQLVIQSCVFNQELEEFAFRFMRQPARISLVHQDRSFMNIRQFYLVVPDQQRKFQSLSAVLALDDKSCMIYCGTGARAAQLCTRLRDSDISACSLHSTQSRQQRQAMIRRYNASEYRVMVLTDLVTYGNVIRNADTVICYDSPGSSDGYRLRISRAQSRFTIERKTYLLLLPGEQPLLTAIRNQLRTDIQQLLL